MANKLLGLEFDIFCPANDYEQQDQVVEHLDKQGFECKKFDGQGAPSWSKLLNDCMALCESDIFVYVSHKNRPNRQDLIKCMSLLKSGYGIVGMFDMTFHAINMDVIRKIGPYDERYLKGGCEEVDMFWRCCENNIGIYINQEAFYTYQPSTWKYEGWKHYREKWSEPEPLIENYLIKLLEEEKYDYDFGPYKGSKFLPWKDSYLRYQEVRKNNYRDWKVLKKNSFFL